MGGAFQQVGVHHLDAGLGWGGVQVGRGSHVVGQADDRVEGDHAGQPAPAAVYQGVDPITAEDVADAIVWAVTRPPNVNIGEIVMWAAAQASTTTVTRRT